MAATFTKPASLLGEIVFWMLHKWQSREGVLNCYKGKVDINVSGGRFAPAGIWMGGCQDSGNRPHVLTMTGGELDVGSEFTVFYKTGFTAARDQTAPDAKYAGHFSVAGGANFNGDDKGGTDGEPGTAFVIYSREPGLQILVR